MPTRQEANSYSLVNSILPTVRNRMDAVRTLISRICEQREIPFAELSRRLGKSHSYIQQFIKRGIPAVLPEDVRWKLSEELDIPEEMLGRPRREHNAATSINGSEPRLMNVNEHDVRASAGHGSFIGEETVVGRWMLPLGYVRNSLSLSSNRLSLIEVIGDSMVPTLQSGDKILVDLDDIAVSQPGVFALYDGDVTVVKRVERVPGSSPAQLMLISDNPHHGKYSVLADQVNVAGRVVWFGRRL